MDVIAVLPEGVLMKVETIMGDVIQLNVENRTGDLRTSNLRIEFEVPEGVPFNPLRAAIMDGLPVRLKGILINKVFVAVEVER